MYTWILGFGVLFSIYNGWGGGANDCANSFATSVGAKVLTLKKAILIASVFEFGGAVLLGSHVTDFVRKKIVAVDIFDDNPGALMFGMLCADLASALWLTFATYYKYPVSTTHSIIGAIIGFSLAFRGNDAINWEKTGLIILSWLSSPLIAGIFSYSIFSLIKRFIFKQENPYQRIRKLFPIVTFFTFMINVLFMIYKGSPQLDLDEMEFWKCFLISFGFSSVFSIASYFFYLPRVEKRLKKEETKKELERRTESYIDSVNNNTREFSFNYNEEDDIDESIKKSKLVTEKLMVEKKEKSIEKLHENADELDKKSDNLFSGLQIITACFSSFAHGSNDVANAIAPLATIYSIWKNEKVLEKADVPVWILAIGGAGIVFGLATWGYRIIDRMGRELTKISPSRGFIIELAAATTVIISSRVGIPVSTTHCQVGSILGCGIVGGKSNIDWKLVRGILFSWFITLPVTGLLSAGLFSYGYYSPSEI